MKKSRLQTAGCAGTGSNHARDYVISAAWSFYLVVMQNPLAKTAHSLSCGAKCPLTKQGWQLNFKLPV
jgi:hypothetical protein